MALASSPTNSPLDEEERALLDSFNQGLAPKPKREDDLTENAGHTPEVQEDVTNANSHQGSSVPVQTLATPAEEASRTPATDDPFAALKNGGANRGTVDLPGPRSDYRVEETSNGSFTIEHVASGEEVRVSGVDYLRFSDLQLHSEFLTRTNPQPVPQDTTAPESGLAANSMTPTQAVTANSFTLPDGDSDATASALSLGRKTPAADNNNIETPGTDSPGTETHDGFYDSAFTTAEDGSITFSAGDLLDDRPGQGAAGLSVVAVTGGANGTLVDNGNDTWTFTPDLDFDGTVELEVTISDGQGGVETATATIEITPVNDNPVAPDQGQAASEDGAVAVGSVVASDADGDPLTYSLASGPAEGSVTVNANGSYSFDPGNDFQDLGIGQSRDVTFTYRADDGQGGSDDGSVTITVSGTNDGPTANDSTATATEDDGATNGSLTASDVDGDSLTYSIVSGPAEGSVTVNADGSYSFDPGADFQDLGVGETRDVSFTYQADDGQGGTSQNTVTVTVSGANDGPSASPGTLGATEDGGTVAGNLSASDVDGDSLTYGLVSGPAEGAVSVNADGSYSFDPGSDFQDLGAGETRDVHFTYQADDGRGETSQNTGTVTVSGTNDGPAVGNQSFQTDGNGAIVITQAELLAGASDIDGDVLSVSFAGNAANGSLTDNGDSTWTFTPAAGFTGQATFGFNVSDGQGGVVGATATIDVADPNNDPIGIVADTLGTDGGDSIVGDGMVNVIDAGAGNDVVDARGGDDTVVGGEGDDYIEGKGGDDLIYGGSGADTLMSGGGDDTVYGGDGDDSLDGNDGSDSLDGGAGDDWLVGDGGDDTIQGGAGSDTMRGGSDDDSLFGGAGNDDLDGGQGKDVLDGGAGNDTIRGDGGKDTIQGGAGDDILAGGQDNDTFLLDSGEGIGDDQIDGGSGGDTIDLTSAQDWTVTYDNGDSFTANDAQNAGLFTDTAGTIDFANGDQVSFENVESFNW